MHEENLGEPENPDPTARVLLLRDVICLKDACGAPGRHVLPFAPISFWAALTFFALMHMSGRVVFLTGAGISTRCWN